MRRIEPEAVELGLDLSERTAHLRPRFERHGRTLRDRFPHGSAVWCTLVRMDDGQGPRRQLRWRVYGLVLAVILVAIVVVYGLLALG